MWKQGVNTIQNNPSLEHVNELRKQFLNAYHEYWLKHSFLTWQWWVLLLTVILFWIVGWKFVDLLAGGLYVLCFIAAMRGERMTYAIGITLRNQNFELAL